jgi:hypothetical protein
VLLVLEMGLWRSGRWSKPATAMEQQHLTHILQKLKLRDRVQAVVLAYQTGLFETDPRGPSIRDETPPG